MVVLPPSSSRPHPVDLLLSGHHYRVSQAALRAAGAAAYDDTGAVITTGPSGPPPGRRESAFHNRMPGRGDVRGQARTVAAGPFHVGQGGGTGSAQPAEQAGASACGGDSCTPGSPDRVTRRRVCFR